MSNPITVDLLRRDHLFSITVNPFALKCFLIVDLHFVLVVSIILNHEAVQQVATVAYGSAWLSHAAARRCEE